MANLVKTYYLPPNWDVPPDGPLKLGSVVSSTKRPLPPLLISPVLARQPPSQIYHTTRHNVVFTTSTSNSASLSIFASLTSAILGGDASGKLSHENTLTLRFARVDTQEWYPSTDELQQRVEHPSIVRFLQRLRAWSTKDLFVVTGIKVAYGARAESKSVREMDGEVKVSLDVGMAGGMPGVAKFGPQLGLGKTTGTNVEWETGVGGEDDSGFVFAFKVHRVKIKKKGGELVATSREYTSGAVYQGIVPVEDESQEYEVGIADAEDATKEDGMFFQASEGDEDLWLVPGPL